MTLVGGPHLLVLQHESSKLFEASRGSYSLNFFSSVDMNMRIAVYLPLPLSLSASENPTQIGFFDHFLRLTTNSRVLHHHEQDESSL